MPNLMSESFTLPCGQVVKNRVCKAAMTERIAKGNNLAHQGHANLSMIIWDWQCIELVEINRCQSIVFSATQ
jgi:hypothetical protein